MFDPVSTYRIQFHKDFTFKNLEAIIPYLHGLGVKTLYASPIFEATPGSTHGYDVVDPLKINPEIGTIEELRAISYKLKESGISWLQDIVPNHMAYHPNNRWLMDVLEKGKQSEYAGVFDIGWDSTVYDGRIMVPFLGLPFDEAVEQKQIQLTKKGKKLFFVYADQQYPVNVDDYEIFTEAHIKNINNDTDLLKQLAARQAYQLCYWQETDKQINYRRFFTVNGLICLNMQNEEVFKIYHQLIKQLLDEEIFQGLRIDHIDGLYDPKSYLSRLRALAGPGVYITVEKILETNEHLPHNWQVQGNTGYDFLAMVNNLFTRTESEQKFTNYYQQLAPDKQSIDQSILDKKAFILSRHMAGELENLYQLFKSLNLANADKLTPTDVQLKEAIAQLLIYCPVYRFYGNAMPLDHAQAAELSLLINKAGRTRKDLSPALQLINDALLERTQQGDESYNGRALRFYQRCMQFTGPLMAKGVEDTLMYTYNRFIGHNEVGDSPASFGYDSNTFHRLMMERQQNWPMSQSTTSTHDTKRGEDVRARLNVLTDIPEEWFELVRLWQSDNTTLKSNNAPDDNDEYFIYQTLIGAHPMPNHDDNFCERIREYLLKALREGKQNSNWAAPDEAYEEDVKKFINSLLNKQTNFRKSFNTFYQRLVDHGIINSLTQVLLKFTCPGIPDVYQGGELWDLSLVDPDNRRPVDYQLRSQYLPSEDAYSHDIWEQLWQSRYTGQIKQRLIQRLLSLRATEGKVFTNGDYLPLTITGIYQQNVLAFARQFGNSWYITVVPLHLAAIGANGAEPLGFDWQDTAIILPEASPRHWHDLIGDTNGYTGQSLPIASLFKSLPLALLKMDHPVDRSAGLLMHITSLPSPFGTGDLGPEAYKFIDFLFNGRQHYWQMLPVNPVDKGAGYSPYSSNSSMAGNTLLISPELLVNNGWLDKEDIAQYTLPSTHHADFDKAAAVRNQLFDKAYQNFKGSHHNDQEAFEQYKSAENYWLEDFALYQVLKQLHENKPWYEWETGLKERHASVIKKLTKQYAVAIDKEKWLQYIFTRQWQGLKYYADKKGVVLFGDMPFYVSYDSVDVWAYGELFKLDKQGMISGIAGVPPDYFSAEGQLWGMPVYNWSALKQSNYNWWLQRIRKNLEYSDLIRLDHFRAFAAYWEVPGGETTAINGTWMQGPGNDFFNAVKTKLGYLPFVAEDLGDIAEAVYQLRDEFKLPGMKVLQFAFGEDMPHSDHIPHNYATHTFAYTGTHDNNTLRGWYKQDIDLHSKRIIDEYIGKKLNDKSICDAFIRLCYASVAKVAIIPMQDILQLDAEHRMNLPAEAQGNWTWRINTQQLTKKLIKELRGLTFLYNR